MRWSASTCRTRFAQTTKAGLSVSSCRLSLLRARKTPPQKLGDYVALDASGLTAQFAEEVEAGTATVTTRHDFDFLNA